ncbi:MAG TPA: DedA family protein [Gemmatimonadota bacterium]|nr:DedA family protein [Gemmatimonadota bacterium]
MADRILEFLVPYLDQYGYATLFLLTFLETSAFLGLVAPGETIIVLCGFYAYRGVLDPWLVGGLATLGAITGDQVGYLLGRTYGHGLITRFGKYFFFDRKRLEATERYYDRHGGKTVFFGRFMSLLRSFGPVVAGISRMPYRIFLPWSVASCIIWGAAFTLIGYFFGASWELIERYLGWGGAVAFALGIALVLWLLHRKREVELEQELAGPGEAPAGGDSHSEESSRQGKERHAS